MNKQKIFFLAPLIFLNLHSILEVTIDSAHAEKIERLKKFSTAVWAEMQRQPSSFFAGVGLGAIIHASSLSTSHYKTIAQITGEKKIDSTQLNIGSFSQPNQAVAKSNELFQTALTFINNQNKHIDLLQEKYNKLLDIQTSVPTKVTWQQTLPHMAAIGGIYGVTQFEKDIFEDKEQEIPVEQNVKNAAAAANIALGFSLSYVTFMAINSFIRP